MKSEVKTKSNQNTKQKQIKFVTSPISLATFSSCQGHTKACAKVSVFDQELIMTASQLVICYSKASKKISYDN